MSRSATFNLLKPLQPPKTAWDKIYEWILGKARIVILITIILIAVAFVAKVVVDTDAKNKQKTIDSLNNRLDFYSSRIEPDFRAFFSKTDNYQKLWNKSSNSAVVIEEIYSYIQTTAADLTVKVDGERVSIYGTEDLNILRDLEEALRESETFSSVTFSNLTIERAELEDQKGEYVVVATIKEPNREKI